MKNFVKNFGWIGVLLISFTSCSDANKMLVSGEIDNPGNVKVVNFYEGDRKLDSTFIGDGNKFKFERAATQERLLTVVVGKNRYPIIAEPGKEIIFKTNLKDPDNYSVSGSDLSQKLKDFAPLKAKIDFVRDSLQQSFTKATVNLDANQIQNLRAQMILEFEPCFETYISKAVDYAKKNDDLAGFYVMSTLDPEMAEAELIDYADKIEGQFGDNRYVNEFLTEVDKLR